MSSIPKWVRDLKPSGPQGSELITQERNGSNVKVDQLSTFLFTKEALERKRRVLEILQSEKVFDKSQNYFAGRIDRFEVALARAKKLRQLQVKHNWTQDDQATANALVSEPGPYGLHESMFLITLRDQGSPEQHEKYLKPAQDYKYIGCYAQTELGHGSNVRGLETTATWNPDDKTFTLNSPYLTSSKWWIGSLGRTANHAVVMAQLVIAGKYYGPHPFVVQVRDMKTHEPLEGVHVGDIGPKVGRKRIFRVSILRSDVCLVRLQYHGQWLLTVQQRQDPTH
jgi:acyl-CoA oxidase